MTLGLIGVNGDLEGFLVVKVENIVRCLLDEDLGCVDEELLHISK